ncbi:MAG: transporter substrate-binding domain-containing protein [Desulfotignum sp.]|nr:transporter substrate-binding domain-containing protein [Desulfotignum sp.]
MPLSLVFRSWDGQVRHIQLTVSTFVPGQKNIAGSARVNGLMKPRLTKTRPDMCGLPHNIAPGAADRINTIKMAMTQLKHLHTCPLFSLYRTWMTAVFLFLWLASSAPGAQQHLKIGVPTGFPSFSYQDGGEREVQGYSVDVLQILCNHLSVTPDYLVGRPEDLLTALTHGDIDLVIGIVLNDTQRRQVHTMEILIYVKRHVFIHYPETQSGRGRNQAVKSVIVQGQPHMASGTANLRGDFIQARSVKEALMMLNSGQAREFIDYSDEMATYLIGKYGLQNIRQAGVQMGRFPFTLIISRENRILQSGLSQALGQAIKTGQLDQVREKWLGKSYAAYLWEQFAPLLVIIVSMAVCVVVFFFFWHMALKKKVTQITRKLKISEEQYRQLIESSPDMVFLINKKGVIQLANKSAEERLKMPAQQLVSHDMKHLVTPEDAGKFDRFLTQLFSHKMAALETRLTRSPHCDIMVEFVAARLRPTNEPAPLACCFARDLTRRKRMEQELMAAERLATIGKMAAGVAHEVNNPIGIILAHTEDLISGELTGGEMADSLNAIRRNAIRAGNITRAILEQASSDESQKSWVDPALMMDACLYFLKPRLKKIHITQSLKPETQAVWGDENQLQQMFINLLLNAIESMNGEGTIRVSGNAVTNTRAKKYCIIIEDSGKGIPVPLRKQIFDPFFTRGKTQGVGLGLFVAQRIIQNHSGNIMVDDSALGGAAIKITLPAKPDESE